MDTDRLSSIRRRAKTLHQDVDNLEYLLAEVDKLTVANTQARLRLDQQKAIRAHAEPRVEDLHMALLHFIETLPQVATIEGHRTPDHLAATAVANAAERVQRLYAPHSVSCLAWEQIQYMYRLWAARLAPPMTIQPVERTHHEQ